MGDIVTEVAKYKKGWVGGMPETPCGSGSTMKETRQQREWLPAMIDKYGIRTVADIGAGDLNWIKTLDWDVEYTPYDLVPRQPEVQPFDLIKQVPPQVDLILCLWVLNHLPFEHCRAAIKNLKSSGAKYLMMTDRPIWREEQPPEIDMPFIEEIVLNGKQDSIRLVLLNDLEAA